MRIGRARPNATGIATEAAIEIVIVHGTGIEAGDAGGGIETGIADGAIEGDQNDIKGPYQVTSALPR